eukprot:14818799-Alexandrium_andersonii.AAC.1
MFRSWLFKQLRESASGTPAGPLRRALGSFGDRFRGHFWARAVQDLNAWSNLHFPKLLEHTTPNIR